MTYCVALYLDEGLVMLADTRTNAGVDNISTFKKMTVWETPGERTIAMMTAGNLAVSQAVVNLIQEGIELEDQDKQTGTILTVPTMFQAARLVGQAVREVRKVDGEALEATDGGFNVSIILGGQIAGRTMRLFRIYTEGNFIEATADTPYIQIGEHKYGKPILDRVAPADTNLVSAVKLCLISMDSTVRSNLSVGPPFDSFVYRMDQCGSAMTRRIEAEDPYFREIANGWSDALKTAYLAMADPPWFG